MIYFDNASTTKYKPEEVYEAFEYYIREIGVSPGRGSYQLGIEASRMLFKSRKIVGKYFGMSKPENVVFTKNSTEAINLFFYGFLTQGDHVVISCYEHNAVLRPLQKLKENGIIEYSVISRNDLELSASEICKKYFKKSTKLFATTLASNLSGRIIFREDVAEEFKKNGATVFVDSSQGAGKIFLNMERQNIDFLAFTGHKDLFAIPGVGGLCFNSSRNLEPLIQGGTGIHGEEYTNPNVFPEKYEAGTLNMPAIWSLHAGITFILNNKNCIIKKEKELTEYLIMKLKELENIQLYDIEHTRVSTCCINVKNMSSSEVVAYLDKNEICVRGGIHCAILAHEALDTVKTGAIRISLSYLNEKEEIDELIRLLKECR
ncbi:aminotransferase class V-fold PLP-dependent enzyme [[Clostridium] fimetarium]|uniref:cysteine desulfurase n=1 Tax=[Clostridium] fimetarium TaxID=99656 RepID=A0A1I0NF64_9FIRM|nr:aminotransferase class V-fold PLP-dependent enzyme [[Clostridium] fimetarium]SEV99878.1 cysteine desulfurase family protein [[Clostridium] fimetarium]